ncbi:MAG: hypothetical protein SFX72_07205 [Isosphaeraceae bacterium]|nr:hypothetical protein [Isosphaeraceae bacterium]
MTAPIASIIVVSFSLFALAPLARGQGDPAVGTTSSADALVHYVPAKGLVFLLECDGFDAHAAGWSRTTASQLLERTNLGRLLDDLARQAIDQAVAGLPSSRRPTTVELHDALRRVLHAGFCVARIEPAGSTLIVIRRGARNGSRGLVERFIAPPDSQIPGLRLETRAGRAITMVDRAADAVAWWSERDDLIVVVGLAGIDAVLQTLDRRAPDAASHPTRTRLAARDRDFEPVVRGFIDPPTQPESSPWAGLEAIDFRWGFQADALQTVIRVDAPAPRSGLFARFDGPTFDRSEIGSLPADLRKITIASIDLARLAAAGAAELDAIAPGAAELAQRIDAESLTPMNINAKRDWFAPLGDRFVFGVKPPTAAAPFDFFLACSIRDRAALAASLDRLAPLLDRAVAAIAVRGAARPKRSVMRPLGKAGPARSTWTIDIPQDALPPALSRIGLRPTLLLGRSKLVIASRPETAKSLEAFADGLGPRSGLPGEFAALQRRIPPKLVALTLESGRDGLEATAEALPATVLGLQALVRSRLAAAGRPPLPPIVLQVDPAALPRPGSSAATLPPAFHAITVDDRGFTLLSRETVPTTNSPLATLARLALFLQAGPAR